MSRVFYKNARVFTGESETDFVTAFAIENGKFVWVGDSSEVDCEDAIDMHGELILPGFIDAHTHPTYISMLVDAIPCTVPVVNSIEEMIAALRKHPNFGKGENAWIEGWGYDESKLAEGRTPTTEDLDKVSTTQPVYVLRSDCHSGICNSRALEIAGITKDTPNPPGAEYGRYPDGRPNGILIEHGANQTVMQAKGSSGFEAEVEKLVRTSEHLSERGIVACADMFCIPAEFEHLDLYREAEKLGYKQLTQVFYDFASLEQYPIKELSQDRKNGRTFVGGLKLFMDGSMSNRTAYMHEPYPDTTDNFGMRTASDKIMQEALDFARENQIQIAFHGMGDAAIETIIDFYGDVEPWMGQYPSVRIEHATLLDPRLIEKMNSKRMKFGVVSNIDFFFAEWDSYSVNLSPEQYARTYMVKEIYRGIEASAMSSDCPATTWADPDNVFMSIKAAVTRRAYNGEDIVQDQKITVPQALLMYTGKAHLVGIMPTVGKIAVGYEASFITLSHDIFSVDPDFIDQIKVAKTWIQGELVWEKDKK
ncbi:amidohydrolase [Actinomyces sp. zg-332]|uniref:amidohydrolase n=1 Tax=Actinomyces sp. zg-332 TaxID=2708340 RepID=UPI0014205386|nr:amidohydrolase [Actinomyces sp. zg-332]QPK94339.1 amidohydrolase [Actinomyces sp. zg-332]